MTALKPGIGAFAALALAAGASDPGWKEAKRSLREAIASDPMDANIVTVLGGAYLFYVAEKGHNPKVNTYWDALVFISTCLSVGYADIFARTPAGQAIASAIMTFGPALSGSFFDAPSNDTPTGSDPDPKLLAVQERIASTLDQVLAELRAGRS